MLLLSTADSVSFRASLAKYQGEQELLRHAERHFLNTYVDAEYAKMTAELKRGKK